MAFHLQPNHVEMSYLHSENTNRPLQFTVRVKFLDLNQALAGTEISSLHDHSEERLGAALLSQGGKRSGSAARAEVRNSESSLPFEPRSEICIDTQEKLAPSAFEEHIELCRACSNRVELQLDFTECLEAAVYQRCNEPESHKIHGALMVSAPLCNFAICGELEVD
jgi:hypothetical protein